MRRIKSIFNKFISDENSNTVNTNCTNYKNCSYCNKPFTEELWCEECDPYHIIEGWTSENSDIDKFIKDTIYNARQNDYDKFLEWVPFDTRFIDIKEIGEGGFSKVYSATWIDGSKSYYTKQDSGDYNRGEPKPTKVALKRLNGSQDMSTEYLNELKVHWNYWNLYNAADTLGFYGITKDPKTKEFMMIIEFANEGNLRNILSKNFNNILWKDKIKLLYNLSENLEVLHESGYSHKDFHSGNILQVIYPYNTYYYISDFGLSGPANKQKSDDKIYGVLPYIAPEVLNGEPYTLSSDIYSFGVIMAELSFGKPPFYDKKHDLSLALAICNGLRPEFGKGTPEIYKELAYKCMNANSNERPSVKELNDILGFWYYSNGANTYHAYKYKEENSGYKGKEIKAIFEDTDKEIPNISTSYDKNSDAIYTSRAFTFNNLPKPVNSSIVTTLYEEDNEVDFHDSQIIDLNVNQYN